MSKSFCHAALLLVLAASLPAVAASWSRQVGPEPGLEFASPPYGTSLCEYGEYLRGLSSDFSGTCSPPLIKFADTFLEVYTETSNHWTYFPLSAAQLFNVKVTYHDVSNLSAITPTFWATDPHYVMNMASGSFHNYVVHTYVPNYVLPNSPNHKNGIPTDSSHPTYLSIDGFIIAYKAIGTVYENQAQYNVTWDSAYPQTSSAWYQGIAAFFSYMKNYAPTVRLSPHVGSLIKDWGWFQTLFANCPALLKEREPVSGLATASAYTRGQLYQQITNLYWFANVALPVFANDPSTRIVQFGLGLDNGDIHTALGYYGLDRGPNTFFELLSSSGAVGVNPAIWLHVANKLGAGTSSVQTPVVRYGYSTSSGYDLYRRSFQGGTAYLNLTGSIRTIALPLGSKNWSGYPITSLTLADGKGDVVLQ